MHRLMRRLGLTAFVLTTLPVLVAACGDDPEPVPERMQRPLLADATDTSTIFLDAGRAQLFFWDPELERYQPGRTPVDEEAMGVAVAPRERIGGQEIAFAGLAIDETASTAAVAYTTGLGERRGFLALLELDPLPMTDPTTTDYPIAPSAQGPFAIPGTEAGFVVVEPSGQGEDTQEAADASWRVFPAEDSEAGPRARRMVWNPEADLVFAASPVSAAVHVLEWPSLNPVTDVATDGLPLDLAHDPHSDQLAVITSASLSLHEGEAYALVDRHPLRGLPWRVHYLREHEELVAILNQNGTLRFFDRSDASMCGVDTQPERKFRTVNLRYVAQPPSAGNRLEGVEAVGCRSIIPSEQWRITFGGEVATGTAEHTATGVLVGPDWSAEGVREGDLIEVDGAEGTVETIDAGDLHFTNAQDVPTGQTVDYTVTAAGAWVVVGDETGLDGRVGTGERFSGSFFTFRLVSGRTEPKPGDRFEFRSEGGVDPIRFTSPGFDLMEDSTGRLMVPLPNDGLVRAIEVYRDDELWTIRQAYTVR